MKTNFYRRTGLHGLCVLFLIGLVQAEPAPSPSALKPFFGAQQLAPGHEPGSFLFSYSGQVGFSQEPAFPVVLAVTDYAGKPVFNMVVTSSAPFVLSTDLAPGSYRLESHVGQGKEKTYWPAFGPQIFIDTTGKATAGATLYGRDLVHEKIMTILSPDPTRTTVVTDARPLLKWDRLPGASRYEVHGLEEDSPHHVASRSQEKTTRTEFRLTESLVAGRRYEWSVTAYGPHDQRLGYGPAAYFYSPGGEEIFAKNPEFPASIQTGVSCLGIAPLLARDFPGEPPGIHVHAVGGNSPAIKAGLQPQDVLTSLNGKSLENVSVAEFIAMVHAIPAGTRVPIEFVRGGVKKTAELTITAMP